MQDAAENLLHDWRDFYALAGAASATLVGLMFVTASIGSNIFQERHRASLKAFVTPTVAMFASVLFTCLIALMPDHNWLSFGGLIGAEGLAGSVYCMKILGEIVIADRYKVDLGDRVFYALLPLAGYATLSAAGALTVLQWKASADVIAAALLLLLLAGIRNAWDMTIWIAVRPPPGGAPPA